MQQKGVQQKGVQQKGAQHKGIQQIDILESTEYMVHGNGAW